MNKLILFGGSFDPIHLGHINIADNASKALDSDVCFIPARISVWKENSVPEKEKIEMVQLAIKDYPRFFISDYELKSKDKINYSYFTALHFKETYSNTKLYFLIGSDHVNSFHKWKYAKELSEITQIVYFHRPGYGVNKKNVKEFNMMLIPGHEFKANSTFIRELNSIELQEEVLHYIENHNLYYIPKVKAHFDSEKRWMHSLSVAKLAYQIAKSTKEENPSKAYQAGLLHDVGKSIKGEKALEFMQKNYPQYVELGSWSYHQFIGAEIVKKEFNIKDESILNAIRYHTTGWDKMDKLGKIIYAADKLDPLRDYDSSNLIKAMMSGVDKGFEIVLKECRDYLNKENKNALNILTSNCYNKYIK